MTNNDIPNKMTNNDISSIVIILILILLFWIFLNNDGNYNMCNRENSINLNSSRSNYDEYRLNYNLSKMAVII